MQSQSWLSQVEFESSQPLTISGHLGEHVHIIILNVYTRRYIGNDKAR